MNKHAATLIEAALAGHLKKADLDPMLLWGLLGAGVGAGTSALKTMTGEQPVDGAALRALRAGVLGAGLGTAGAGGLKLMGVNPRLPHVVDSRKTEKTPVSSSVGVGMLGAGALGAAGALDRERAANRTLSANADVLRRGGAEAKATLEDELGQKVRSFAPRDAQGNVKSTSPSLLRRLLGYNRTGHNLGLRVQQLAEQAGATGQAARALDAEKLMHALRTKGNVARPTGLGRMPLKQILAGGGVVGLAHYLANRRKEK